MTAAERSELAELRAEIAGRFDRIDDGIRDMDARVRTVESFVSSERGRQEARAGQAAGRVQWAGVAVAVAVCMIAVPGSILAMLQVAGVVG